MFLREFSTLNIRVNEKILESVWYGPAPEDAPTLIFLHEGLGRFPCGRISRKNCPSRQDVVLLYIEVWVGEIRKV
ncbi:MAG: hypothetical protein CM1200mP28_17130 [Deltaproteobacteria bacterium]|nr:MAG: hypothetical protein CM1200mP28_17130 [Deltaproteobacteria bacterium]